MLAELKNLDKRRSDHNRSDDKSGLKFNEVASGLTREEARFAEQAGIVLYGTLRFYNRINGISRLNPNLPLYIQYGLKELAQCTYNVAYEEIRDSLYPR